MHCDVVNVQPRFNFSDGIIILNLEGEEGGKESGEVAFKTFLCPS